MLCCSAWSCSSKDQTRQLRLGLATDDSITIDVDVQHQVIDGFGASSAWTAQSLNEVEADLLFSRETGLGVSLLRLRITPSGTTWEQTAAIRAHLRGVGVWAAPWSPPGEWKTNGSDFNGGSLLPEHYQDWADRLAQFAKNKQQEGVQLVGISAQNEPDWVADWETCEWTPEQLVTFIRDYLGPTLRQQAPGTPIIAPEAANWNSLPAYADAILLDAAAAAEVEVIGVHSYGGLPYAYEAPAAAGKRFWETEISYEEGVGVEAAVYTAARIHDHLTIANMNAFHWWWLKVDAGSALIVDGVVSPQGYGFGHFSKFVRPGYVRVMAVADEPVAEVLTSAYWERDESTLAIVAINQGDAEVTQSFLLKGLTPIRVTPWLTSSDTTLREQARLRAQNPLSVTLPGQSITTLVVLAEADTLGAGGASGASAGGAAGAASVEAGPGSNTSSTGSDAGTPNGSGGASISASGSTASAADATTSGNTSTGSKDEKVPSLGKGPHAACLCSAPGQPVNHTPWPLLLLVWPVLRWRRRTHHAAG